jgi:hypothetical protein
MVLYHLDHDKYYKMSDKNKLCLTDVRQKSEFSELMHL